MHSVNEINKTTMYTLPIVTVTHQGKPLSLKMLSENPELGKLYPSPQDFMEKLYLPSLKKLRETGEAQLIEITEHGITINGKPFSLD